jgi:hypothetical protein
MKTRQPAKSQVHRFREAKALSYRRSPAEGLSRNTCSRSMRKKSFPKHLAAKWIKHDRKQADEKLLAESNTGQLAVLEEIIEDGLQTALAVGAALKVINDQKLWKTGYASWKSYVNARWPFGVRYADYLISAAKVVEVLGVVGGPKSVGTAREFAALVEKDPEVAQAIWKDLKSHYPEPTVKQAHDFVKHPKPAVPPKPMEEHTRLTLHYIKIVLAKYFADKPGLRPGLRPGMKGWSGSLERRMYLMAIHHYVEEQMYFSFGAYRGKPKPDPDPPFEEPSAEHPGPTREQLISAAIGDKGSSS